MLRGFFLIFLIGVSSCHSAERRAPPINPEIKVIQDWCDEIQTVIGKWNWKVSPCETIDWKVGGRSVKNRALIYAEFGDVQADNTSLVLSTVHGDEITPVYLGLQLAHWLNARQDQLKAQKKHVILAPIINPDGFLNSPKQRMNAHGVDLNRNFSTKDWNAKALLFWKKRYRSDVRRFPGMHSSSEPETRFQEELIARFKPQKILSIHSPLNFLDYDGPSTVDLVRFRGDATQVCDQFRRQMRAISGGFFPGSLGNYAGRDLGIPTLTLELPSSDPARAMGYWKRFWKGIDTMIQFQVPSYCIPTVPKVP